MSDIQIVEIDFSQIKNSDDFYIVLKEKLDLPDYFGSNLDALYDSLTGYVKTPLLIQFKNMSLGQLNTFSDLIAVFKEVEDEIEDFDFEYYIQLEP